MSGEVIITIYLAVKLVFFILHFLKGASDYLIQLAGSLVAI